MPGRNGMGPAGFGPRTGRGMGHCAGSQGRGIGYGWGRGNYGRGFGYGAQEQVSAITHGNEMHMLSDRLEALEREALAIRERLGQIGSEEKDM